MNTLKGNKLESLVLVDEGTVILISYELASPLYYLFCGKYPGVKFFALWHYKYFTEEGPEENVFDPPQSMTCQRSFMKSIYDTYAENKIGGIDKEVNLPVLPSGNNTNRTAYNMYIIFCIGITTDNDNDPVP